MGKPKLGGLRLLTRGHTATNMGTDPMPFDTKAGSGLCSQDIIITVENLPALVLILRL